MMAPLVVHGTAIAFHDDGILLRGAPGAGKSSLALQLIDTDGFGTGHDPLRAVLIADDQVCITQSASGPSLSAPKVLAGLLEIRGIGIVTVPYRLHARLVMAVDLVSKDIIQRLPDPASTDIGGQVLPLFRIDAHEPAAAARLRSAYCSVLQASGNRLGSPV